MLAVIFAVLVIFGALGYFSGTIGQWLNRTPTAGMWLDRIAGAMLLPYLAWLCLATTLNWEIGRLNPGADRAPLGITGA